MNARPRVTPSGWWFAAAVLAAVVGLTAGIAVIVVGAVDYGDKIDDFERADMPATLEVEISDPGGYSIYHEYEFVMGSRPEPEVEVTDPSGRAVPLDTYDADVSYTISGHEGVGVYTFDADEAGTYTVDASMPTGERFDDVIAVGPGIGQGLVVAVAGGIALMGVGVVGGIVIAIVVGVMRSRSRRAAMPPPVVAWGPPGQWGAPWWQAPPGPPPGAAPGPGWPAWPPAQGGAWPPAPGGPAGAAWPPGPGQYPAGAWPPAQPPADAPVPVPVPSAPAAPAAPSAAPPTSPAPAAPGPAPVPPAPADQAPSDRAAPENGSITTATPASPSATPQDAPASGANPPPAGDA